MKRSKKIFVGLAVTFFIALAFVSFDISRKTTFPGAKAKPENHTSPAPKSKKDTVRDSLAARSAVHLM